MDKKTTYIIVGVALLVAVTVSALLISKGTSSEPVSNDLPGLQETRGPWQLEYTNLLQRIQTLNIPPPGSEKYHIHARMAIYIDGQQQPIPANIGLDSSRGVMAALHTHDTDSIIHVEADQPRDVRLSEFFGIWGVKFSGQQIGGYKNSGDRTVQVYVNGKKIDDPVNYLIQPHDTIIVGYGQPGSFPVTAADPFPSNL